MNRYLKITRWLIVLAIACTLYLSGEFLFSGQASIAYAQEATPTTAPPAEIPEPITVILFGTGLAALSAASALRKSSSDE